MYLYLYKNIFIFLFSFKMLSIKYVNNLSDKEINECNKLINFNFKTNRFKDYVNVIIYKINNEIIGFVGIYDNLLNQLCINLDYRRKGIATEIINISKKFLKKPIYLYIDKQKENTDYLLHFYIKNKFIIELENEIEYKMIYK